MSNFEATRLYEQVIEEVITDSRQDFEDSGIDESTLQELRKIWCQKLSQSSIAKFSWDEEASREEEEALRQQQQEQQQEEQIHQDELHQQQQLHHEVPVPAPDGDLHSSGLELPNSALSYNTTTSVASNNSGLQLPGIKSEDDVGDDNGLMIPTIGQADGTIEFTMYSSEAARLMEKIKRKNQNNLKKLAQADGADDFDDDDIYNDSDDINSDLDDDVESDKEDDEDGQDDGQIMLCLYDKVQRVKNKWKSTLKEGVANINGRDYVFQKANGESEW
ncbi:transcription initiation factor IIA large subunit [[Candida] railenensis]|uniref:Transcription initiation factor IIA large subunit n=1 Tax=[Candida] railenensis TaxID=45579 RepID=A0A9P0QUG0_9ASCO|nr:transcription initiation factor IIA large subunit [[Candida] railenensis]